MKKIWLLILFFSIFASSANASQIDSIRIDNDSTNSKRIIKKQKDFGDWRFRMGGYGEILFQYFDYTQNRFFDEGSHPDSRAEISIPRFILAMDFKFSPSWTLTSEIEFEYGGTGSAVEYEFNEAGEYEMEVEKGGEVVLEQFHINKRFADWLHLRIGHFIVPVGLTNAHHEPIFYFGATRPEGESNLIPCTWHETGLSLYGTIKNFDYEIMVINGLDPNFFSRENFIKKGKQSLFETYTMTNPALAGRIDYNGIKHMRLGISAYHAWKTSGNSTKADKMEEIKIPVTVLSADAQFDNKIVVARANFLWGEVGDSERLSILNLRMPSKAGISIFPRDQVAKNAINWYAEIGVNIGQFISKKLHLYPFLKYEYYNSMHKTDGNIIADPRFKRELLTAGINYFALPNLVIKADYSRRWIDHGNFNSENRVSLSIGYLGWFFKR